MLELSPILPSCLCVHCIHILVLIYRLTSASTESAEWSSAKLLLVSLLSHGSDEVMETTYQYFVVRHTQGV